MARLFFWRGTTGGLGIILLLAATSVAVIAFFARDPRGENAWRRLAAPALAGFVLTGIAVLAVQHYAILLGVPPGDPAAWVLPGCYGRGRGGRAGMGAGAQDPPPARSTPRSASARTPSPPSPQLPRRPGDHGASRARR